MKVDNAVLPMKPAITFFDGSEDGPFVMVNLPKFIHPRADGRG